MCRRISCSRCGRPTYAGCGAHIEQVLAGVPMDQRCHCREDNPPPPSPLNTLRAWLTRTFRR